MMMNETTNTTSEVYDGLMTKHNTETVKTYDKDEHNKMHHEKHGEYEEDKTHKKHYRMSLAEITDKLHEEFEDEIEGANEYLNMANSAASMGHMDLADTLLAMAKDEFSHARFIHCFMKESGVHVSDEVHEDWKELENRFHKVFYQEIY